jgi:predicted nucleic acid-binding protein
MSKLVIDADGLIKLGKSGVLGMLTGSHEVLVPAAVYEEAVVRGKRELYEDAFELEKVLEEQGVSASSKRPAPEADRLLEGVTSLGAGERDALRLYFAEGADAVLSDDRVFLSFCGRHSVPFLTPTNVIVAMTRSGRMSTKEGAEALEKLSGYVRAEVYERARAELDELREESEENDG